MRKIIFRGKRLDNGEWVEGYLVNDLYINTGNPFAHIWMENHCIQRIDPATVGQFTGLTDRNGVEIYEGDIVRNQQHPGGFLPLSEAEIGAVVFRYDGQIEVFVGGEFNRSRYLFGQINEVIGNIHDNPELLKTEQR